MESDEQQQIAMVTNTMELSACDGAFLSVPPVPFNNYPASSSSCLFQLPFGANQPIGPPSGPNAPPPSSCGTGSEHSGSACPSPGPMKRFRQLYGNNDLPQQPSSSTSSSSTRNSQIVSASKRAAMHWTENWMNTHHGGCSTRPSISGASSIISTGSAVTQLSALSVDTQLSVVVDSINLDDQPFQNVDPCYFQQMHSHLSHVIKLLGEADDDTSQFNALCQLYRLIKSQKLVYCTEAGLICRIVQLLVEIILRPNTQQRTRSLVLNVLCKIAAAGNICLSAIRSLESSERGFFLNAIILCLRSDVENDSRYATNILSTLLVHPVMGEFFRRQARTQHVVRELMVALNQNSYGFRHRFLKHIHLLIRASKELKRFFHLSNGMQICLDLFQSSVDEPMLHECAALLLALVDDPTGLQTMADCFVKLNGIQILASHLSHGSPRLLLSIARCLAVTSDSDQIAHQSIGEAIRLSIQLLASTDGELVRHLVGFLANIQAKNPGAKVFMQEHEAIPNLLFLLSVWANSTLPVVSAHNCQYEEEKKGNCELCAHYIAQRNGIEEVIDTVLLALCNLTNGVNANPLVSCQSLINQCDDSIQLFHQILIPIDRAEPIRIRTLTLLSRLLMHLPDILDRFSKITDCVCTLLGLFSNAIRRVTQNQKNSDKNAKSIASLCLSVLNKLIIHQTMFGAVVSLIRGTGWNPFALFSVLKDEKLETSLAEFLYKLSMSSEILAEWTRFKSDIEHFENIPHISRYIYPISQMITYITNANTGF